MNLQNLEEKKTDHLFLLIGSNPLPNYVIAKLLCKINTKIHLICSKQTIKSGERIRDVYLAQDKQEESPREITVYELSDSSDALAIQNELKKKLPNIGFNESVGLNYTGGTKVMAAHIFSYFKDMYGARNFVFSYLDASELALRFDQRQLYKIKPNDLMMDIETLAQLHHLKIDKKDSDDTEQFLQNDRLIELSKKMFEYLKEDFSRLETYRFWCDRNLRGFSKNKDWTERYDALVTEKNNPLLETYKKWFGAQYENGQTGEQLFRNGVEFFLSEGKKVKKADLESLFLPEFVGAEKTLGALGEEMHDQTGWTKSKEFYHYAEFLDGIWLEYYLFDLLYRIKDELELADQKVGIKFIRSSGSRFEFDVAITRGYQLFAFSCSSDTTTYSNKQKLFEVYTRARQMGGDEARIGLFCGHENSQQLLQHIEEEWQTLKDSIKVFGHDMWKDLETHLKEWIIS